ncbi:MAG: hypothetical protein K0Q72_1252 [Armatimonadetes bacterium]|jgi:hypothetical protein|nr:hypothetical protein [Armatimonadota bacterium]
MRIVPKDLGLAWHVRFLQARDSPDKVGAEAPEPQLGVVGRLCSSDMGLDESSAAALVPAAKEAISNWLVPLIPALPVSIVGSALLFIPLHQPIQFLPLYLGTVGLAAAASGIGWARARFRRLLEAPLSAEEVDRLLEKTSGSMDRLFLELVRDAVRQPGPAATEANLREALGSLAAAIERLPPLEAVPLDTAVLRQEAQALELQAGTEPDRVTSESLERRARALRYSAETHEHSALMFRRAAALRSEIESQIVAMREGLMALHARALDATGFAELASSAREVATEAIRLAAAREELAGAVESRPTVIATAAGVPPPALQTITAGGSSLPGDS